MESDTGYRVSKAMARDPIYTAWTPAKPTAQFIAACVAFYGRGDAVPQQHQALGYFAAASEAQAACLQHFEAA